MEESAHRTKDRKIPNILTHNLLRYLFSPPERLLEKYVEPGERAADLGCGAGFHTLPRLLASFRLLDSGEGLLTRWALVGPGDGDPAAEPLFEEDLTCGA